MFGLDAIERRLVVLGRVGRSPQDDELERLRSRSVFTTRRSADPPMTQPRVVRMIGRRIESFGRSRHEPADRRSPLDREDLRHGRGAVGAARRRADARTRGDGAIMGPSGCGKTTLLNCSGLDAVDEGEVVIDGTSLSEMSDRERTDYRARHMGFVFQFYNLMPVLTAVENVELPLIARESAAPRGAARSRRSTWSGWPTAAAHVPDELSGGERQRVTIARSLVNDPAIVWADEPTGDLDSENAQDIVALMRELNLSRGLSFLIVTHDIAVGRQTDRIVRMLDGTVVEEQRLEVPRTRESRCLRSTPSASTSTTPSSSSRRRCSPRARAARP